MNANHNDHIDMKNAHMNLTQLRCFAALLDKGSFTEASYTVGLTQSAVSHALAALEAELGVTLIERDRKGVGPLTRVGHKISPHIRALLAHAEAIEQEAKAAQGMAKGKLRLGSPLGFCPGLFAGTLTCFQRQYPDIDVVLFEGTLQEVEEWIAGRIVDLGFVVHPAQGIESTLLAFDEMCVLVPSGHRLHAQSAVTPSALRDEGWIMSKSDCGLQAMEMVGLEIHRTKPSIRYQANDSATILAMVREGLGIALMPRMVLPKKLDGVVALPLDPPGQLQIGLAVKSRDTTSPGAKLFIQTALSRTAGDTS
jgi:DNA-binding transcriptional LysR family regulator